MAWTYKKPAALLVVLLLQGNGTRAQAPAGSPPPPQAEPSYQRVSVPVPRAVTLATDVLRVLLAPDDGSNKVQALIDRRRARSKKGEQSLVFRVPNNGLTRGLGLVE